MTRTDILNEKLTTANECAAIMRDTLIAANTHADEVEHIVLLELIATAIALETKINALHHAIHACNNSRSTS